MYSMRSGAENHLQNKLSEQKVYTDNLRLAVEQAIRDNDVSGLQAALDVRPIWRNGGWCIPPDESRELDSI